MTDPNAPIVGRIYRHYRGSKYKVLAFWLDGRYKMVTYQNIATGEQVTRDYEQWKQRINHNQSVQPTTIDQFTICD